MAAKEVTEAALVEVTAREVTLGLGAAKEVSWVDMVAAAMVMAALVKVTAGGLGAALEGGGGLEEGVARRGG